VTHTREKPPVGVGDWFRDRFAGKALRHPGQVVYVEANGAWPNSATVARKRQWYESEEMA